MQAFQHCAVSLLWPVWNILWSRCNASWPSLLRNFEHNVGQTLEGALTGATSGTISGTGTVPCQRIPWQTVLTLLAAQGFQAVKTWPFWMVAPHSPCPPSEPYVLRLPASVAFEPWQPSCRTCEILQASRVYCPQSMCLQFTGTSAAIRRSVDTCSGAP